MSRIFLLFSFILIFVSFAASQQVTREQKMQKIKELRSQVSTLEKDVLSPTAEDVANAKKLGLNAIRINPRGKYDSHLTVRGGGAYYSFVRRTHEYGRGSDISLQRENLETGFAGADYGFIHDVGERPLSEIGTSTEINFLSNYTPPSDEPEIRSEQSRSHNYETNGIILRKTAPVVVGHSYLLRSINFGSSDILIGFRVIRKDTDGSIIIFFKPMKTFESPIIARRDEVFGAQLAEQSDSEIFTRCQTALIQKGFNEVQIEVNEGIITLRGTIGKDHLAEVLETANEVRPKKVVNQMTVK